MTPGPAALPRLPALEGLRGLLALWVLFSHTVTAAGLGEDWRGPFAVLRVGTHAVDTFVILSGFVISYLIVTARESYPVFVARRALRLYPVYLICLLAAAALLPMLERVHGNLPFHHPHNDFLVAIFQRSQARLPEHLLAHLTLLHAAVPTSVLPMSNYAILHPAWSLSLEWQFYLVAPALLWALLRGPRTALAAVAAVCATHALLPGPQGFLARHVPEFALGIASFLLWREAREVRWPLLLPLAVALAWLLTKSPPVVVWAAVFAAVLNPRGIGAGALNRALEASPLQALGRWSYPVYVSHTLVLLLALQLLLWLGAAALGQWAFFALLLALTAAGTVTLSAWLHRAVEAPAIAFGRRLSRPPPAAARFERAG